MRENIDNLEDDILKKVSKGLESLHKFAEVSNIFDMIISILNQRK